jgi:hypothetical protein
LFQNLTTRSVQRREEDRCHKITPESHSEKNNKRGKVTLENGFIRPVHSLIKSYLICEAKNIINLLERSGNFTYHQV